MHIHFKDHVVIGSSAQKVLLGCLGYQEPRLISEDAKNRFPSAEVPFRIGSPHLGQVAGPGTRSGIRCTPGPVYSTVFPSRLETFPDLLLTRWCFHCII